MLAVVATSTIVSRSSDNAYFKLPKDKNHLELLLKNRAGYPVVKNLPSNAGNVGSIPGPGRCHMPWGT